MKLKNRTPDSGIQNTTLATDAVDRDFDYYPLYRLLKTTGREAQNQSSSYLWDDATKSGTPTPSNVRSYPRKYWYDKMGNMNHLKNEASNNNLTRDFTGYSSNNQIDKILNGQSNTLGDFSFDVAGNLAQSDTT